MVAREESDGFRETYGGMFLSRNLDLFTRPEDFTLVPTWRSMPRVCMKGGSSGVENLGWSVQLLKVDIDQSISLSTTSEGVLDPKPPSFSIFAPRTHHNPPLSQPSPQPYHPHLSFLDQFV